MRDWFQIYIEWKGLMTMNHLQVLCSVEWEREDGCEESWEKAVTNYFQILNCHSPRT
jgi:hypothetical protein